jgi:hypothetical protein
MKMGVGSWKMGKQEAWKTLAVLSSSLRFDATAPEPKAKAGTAVPICRDRFHDCILAIQSARGLAQSKTWRQVGRLPEMVWLPPRRRRGFRSPVALWQTVWNTKNTN